ncbi:MAG TPA: hypothetical protein PKH54_11170 [Myxococcota bacterium]|nr:hypothetical protein [Myxococcota bacterium]
MRNFVCVRMIMARSVLVLLPVLSAVACSSGPDPATGECMERETALNGKLAECQASATSATSACAASQKAASDELAAVKARLETLERENAELKQTPAAVSQEILTAVDSADTIAKIDDVLASISAFGDRFPGAPEIRVVTRKVSGLKSARAKLVRAEEQAKALQAISDIKALLAGAEDADELSFTQILAVANHLSSNNIKYSTIAQLPRGNFGEAMKDPDSERGKSMVISGRVVQISKDGDYFKGLICTGDFCDRVYYFITPGTTRGISQESYVSFAGVLAQRYSYSNSGGGTTHSVALVGYFKGQE